MANLLDEGVNTWRENKGIGSAYMFAPLDDKQLVTVILSKFYNKDPTRSVIVAVGDYSNRKSILNCINSLDVELKANINKAIVDKTLKILTEDIIENIKSVPDLMILYRITEFTGSISRLFTQAKFKLAVFNKIPEFNNAINKIAPPIKEFEINKVIEAKLNLPVVEKRLGTGLGDQVDNYNELTDFISTSMNIFNSFENIQKANAGDVKANMSALEYCSTIAANNGWSYDLDLSQSFNKSIDDMYNPNNLKDRAFNTISYIQARNTMLVSNPEKLTLLKQVLDDIDNTKKILIISKKGDFASTITAFINSNTRHKCANVHNKVLNVDAEDLYGNPIYIKSGVNKGKRKQLGVDGQKTLNVGRYIANLINVISCTNSIDRTLAFNVDVIIITTPLGMSFKDFLYRMDKVIFNTNPIQLYVLFTENTPEQKRLKSTIEGKNYAISTEIVNKSENIKETDDIFSEIFGD